MTSFALAPTGQVYIAKTDGSLLVSDSGLPGSYRSLSGPEVGYALDPAGDLSRIVKDLDRVRATVASSVMSFALASSGRVYALKTDEVLIASDDGRPGTFWVVDTDVSSFTMNAEGTLSVQSQARGATLTLWNVQQTVTLTASLASGVLRVEGTEAADVISVSQSNGQIAILGTAITDAGTQRLQVAANQVSRIEIHGRGGNDTIRLDVGSQTITAPATIYGEDGNDEITGGGGDDQLHPSFA